MYEGYFGESSANPTDAEFDAWLERENKRIIEQEKLEKNFQKSFSELT